MRFKLFNIKGCDTCEQVCIAFARNDEGNDFLEVTAWHKDKETKEWWYQYEVIGIDDEMLLSRVFHDFSEMSANEFANSFTF